MKRLLPLAFAGLLASCGQGDDTVPQPSSEPAETAAAEMPRPAAPFPAAALVLSSDGIAVKGDKGLTFGSARGAVEALASRSLGTEPQRGRNAECGAGPMDFSSYGPLQLLFQDGKLAGWYLARGDGPRIVTVDGIAPGARMDALAAERQVRPIADSTLEGEFEYLSGTGGMVTGFYQGDLRSGTITALAAGTTCFFR